MSSGFVDEFYGSFITLLQQFPYILPLYAVTLWVAVPFLLFILALYWASFETPDEDSGITTLRAKLYATYKNNTPAIGFGCVLWSMFIILNQTSYIYNNVQITTSDLSYYLQVDLPEYNNFNTINTAETTSSYNVQSRSLISAQSLLSSISHDLDNSSHVGSFEPYNINTNSILPTVLEREEQQRRLGTTIDDSQAILSIIYYKQSWENVLTDSKLVSICASEKSIISTLTCLDTSNYKSAITSIFNSDCQYLTSYEESLELFHQQLFDPYVQDHMNPATTKSAILISYLQVGSCSDEYTANQFEDRLAMALEKHMGEASIDALFFAKPFKESQLDTYAMHDKQIAGIAVALLATCAVFLLRGVITTTITMLSVGVSTIQAIALLPFVGYATVSDVNIIVVALVLLMAFSNVSYFGSSFRRFYLNQGDVPTMASFVQAHDSFCGLFYTIEALALVTLLSSLALPLPVLRQMAILAALAVVIFFVCCYYMILPFWMLASYFTLPKWFHRHVLSRVNSLCGIRDEDDQRWAVAAAILPSSRSMASGTIDSEDFCADNVHKGRIYMNRTHNRYAHQSATASMRQCAIELRGGSGDSNSGSSGSSGNSSIGVGSSSQNSMSNGNSLGIGSGLSNNSVNISSHISSKDNSSTSNDSDADAFARASANADPTATATATATSTHQNSNLPLPPPVDAATTNSSETPTQSELLSTQLQDLDMQLSQPCSLLDGTTTTTVNTTAKCTTTHSTPLVSGVPTVTSIESTGDSTMVIVASHRSSQNMVHDPHNNDRLANGDRLLPTSTGNATGAAAGSGTEGSTASPAQRATRSRPPTLVPEACLPVGSRRLSTSQSEDSQHPRRSRLGLTSIGGSSSGSSRGYSSTGSGSQNRSTATSTPFDLLERGLKPQSNEKEIVNWFCRKNRIANMVGFVVVYLFLFGLYLTYYYSKMAYVIEPSIPQLFPANSNLQNVLGVLGTHKSTILGQRPYYNPLLLSQLSSLLTVSYSAPPTAAPIISPTTSQTIVDDGSSERTAMMLTVCWGMTGHKEYEDSLVDVIVDETQFADYISPLRSDSQSVLDNALMRDQVRLCDYVEENRDDLWLARGWERNDSCLADQLTRTYNEKMADLYSGQQSEQTMANTLLVWASADPIASTLLGIRVRNTQISPLTYDPVWICTNFSLHVNVSSLQENPSFINDIERRWAGVVQSFGSDGAQSVGVQTVVGSVGVTYPLIQSQLAWPVAYLVFAAMTGYILVIAVATRGDVFFTVCGTFAMCAIGLIAVCLKIYVFSATLDIIDAFLVVGLTGVIALFPMFYLLHFIERKKEEKDKRGEDVEKENTVVLSIPLLQATRFLRLALLGPLILSICVSVPLLYASLQPVQKTGQYLLVGTLVSYVFSTSVYPFLLSLRSAFACACCEASCIAAKFTTQDPENNVSHDENDLNIIIEISTEQQGCPVPETVSNRFGRNMNFSDHNLVTSHTTSAQATGSSSTSMRMIARAALSASISLSQSSGSTDKQDVFATVDEDTSDASEADSYHPL